MEHPKPDPKYKVERQGKYNRGVDDCQFCGTHIDIWSKDAIGFCDTGQFHQHYGIVFRCPKCFEVQWCHSDAALYNGFCHYRKSATEQAFAVLTRSL